MQNMHGNFISGQFIDCAFNCFNRTLNVSLDDNGQLLGFTGFNFIQHLFHRRFCAFDQFGFTFFTNTVSGYFARLVFIFNDDKIITGRRRPLQPQNLNRRCRCCFKHLFTVFIKHGTDMSPLFAGNAYFTDF